MMVLDASISNKWGKIFNEAFCLCNSSLISLGIWCVGVEADMFVRVGSWVRSYSCGVSEELLLVKVGLSVSPRGCITLFCSTGQIFQRSYRSRLYLL